MRTLASIIVALAVLTAGRGQAQSSPQAIFEAAIRAEMVDGDLARAIAFFERVVAHPSVDRALAATALLRMARAYETLDEVQARDTYQRIVSEFGDQSAQVAEAQARLEALRSSQANQTARGPEVLPQPPEEVVGFGLDYKVTADGRYGIFTSYLYAGFNDVESDSQNVGLFEYETAKVAWATDLTFEEGQVEGLVVSPDGSRVAYSVARRAEGATEVYVGPLGGTARMIYREENPDVLAEMDSVPIWLSGWTPDDGLIGLRWIGGDWTSIIRLDVPTGTLDQITTFPQELAPIRLDVSPDGRTIAIVRPVDNHSAIYTYAIDGAAEFQLTNNRADTSIRDLLWSRDGRHILFTSSRGPGLWAVPVKNGRQDGQAFLVQESFTGVDLAWAGDKLSYYESTRVHGVFTMSLDTSTAPDTSIARASYSPKARERYVAWSSQGDLSFIAVEGPARTLVIQQSNGQTRERPVPPELVDPQVINFNGDGTTVALYSTGQHDQLALYDLPTDDWSYVAVPAAEPGWRKRLGYTALQGGPGSYVIYYLVAEDNPAAQDEGAFEIHRLDAVGLHTTAYSASGTLLEGAQPLWLSTDGRSLRFGEGSAYRELDLATDTLRTLLTLDTSLAQGQQMDGPRSSPDGTTVAVRLSADRSTLRVFDVDTGISRDLTVPRMALSDAMGLSPTAPDDFEAEFRRFRLSPTGDQVAFDARAFSGGYRYVADDPLAAFLRDRGGR